MWFYPEHYYRGMEVRTGTKEKEAAVDELIEAVSLGYKKQFNVLPEAYVVETGGGARRVNE